MVNSIELCSRSVVSHLGPWLGQNTKALLLAGLPFVATSGHQFGPGGIVSCGGPGAIRPLLGCRLIKQGHAAEVYRFQSAIIQVAQRQTWKWSLNSLVTICARIFQKFLILVGFVLLNRWWWGFREHLDENGHCSIHAHVARVHSQCHGLLYRLDPLRPFPVEGVPKHQTYFHWKLKEPIRCAGTAKIFKGIFWPKIRYVRLQLWSPRAATWGDCTKV